MKSPRTVWSVLSIAILVAFFVAAGIWVFSSTSSQGSQVASQAGTPVSTPAVWITPTLGVTPPVLGTPTATRTPFILTPPPVTPPSILPTIVTPTIILTETVTPGPFPTPAPTPAIVLDGPFKGWYMYENKDFGFRIKFPPQFAFYTPFAEPGARPYRELVFIGIFYDKARYKPGTVGSPFPAIGLTVLDNPKRLPSLDAYVRAYLDPNSYGPRRDSAVHFRAYDNPRQVQVNGVQILRFVDRPMGTTNAPTMLARLQGGSRVLKLNYDATSLELIFDSMVSTFESIQ